MNPGFLFIIGNVFRTAKLRTLLLACLGTGILLPYYSTSHVMPLFFDQLMRNTENEACRTAAYLTSTILDDSAVLTPDLFTAGKVGKIDQVVRDFDINKLKVFSRNGTIIHSTTKGDIGEINLHPYFWETVAKGKVFSKIVVKDHQFAEGDFSKRDVAEVYIPIINGKNFVGALEIYYDITAQKRGLDQVQAHSSRLLFSLSGLLLIFAVNMLYRASKSMIERGSAEQRLQETNRSLEKIVFEQTAEIRMTQKTSIEALATLTENYDPDTGSHLSRIQKYVGLLLLQLEKASPYSSYIREKEDYRAQVQLASILHDIGKVAVDRAILLKPGRLTREEFEAVKCHTLIAGELLAKANQGFVDTFGKDSYLALAGDIALYHHERWDGSGYPHGLAGEDIPLAARVVALADVYDALRSLRPYKPARTHAFSVGEICRSRGSHFDPCIVDAFLAQADRLDEVAGSLYKNPFAHPENECLVGSCSGVI
jgi:response regulator RpfG family c-di-GMP phosphodiesterase